MSEYALALYLVENYNAESPEAAAGRALQSLEAENERLKNTAHELRCLLADSEIRAAELVAENRWLKETLAIPPGYRLQPIDEFDAMEAARLEADALLARVAELESLVVALAESEREPD